MTNQMSNFPVLPCLAVITLTIGMLSVPAMAETVYKSVDAEGNVTFSSSPPAGVEAQQIELQPGPTPAEQQQSLEAEQRLEAQSNDIPEQQPAPEQEDEPAVQPDTDYQQDAGDNEDPVPVDDAYVGDVDRDERVRDSVDDVREIQPLPTEIHRPAGRVR